MHIQKIVISAFRGFDYFEAGPFAPFTIIGGKNNSGKTSLLEAILYLANRSAGIAPGHLIVSRKMSLRKRDLLPLFHCLRPGELMVSATFSDGTKRGLSLETDTHPFRGVKLAKSAEMADLANAELPVYAQQWYTRFSDGETVHGLSEIAFTRDEYKVRERKLVPSSVRGRSAQADTWKCRYYQTRSMGNMIPVYREVFKKKKDGAVADILRTIDPRVEGIAFDGEQVLVDVGLKDARLPLEVMGDGSVKAADIIALAALAKKGDVLCIDEIENGLHFSIMSTFIRMLVQSVEKFGIQILATTHNLELMQAVADQSVAESGDFFGYINLTRGRKGRIFATAFNHREFVANLENEIEIR